MSPLTYALSRSRTSARAMSVSGIINTHFIAYLLLQHGTEQKRKYLPRMATGEVRGAFSMSEPRPLAPTSPRSPPRLWSRQARPERLDRRGALLRDHRPEMWLTNGGSANLVAVLVKTDEGADGLPDMITIPWWRRIPASVRPRRRDPPQDREDGLQGVDTTEMVFDGHRIRLRPDPRRRAQGLLPDDDDGRGRPRSVAARGCGVASQASSSGRPTPSSGRRSARRSPSTRRCCSGSRKISDQIEAATR